MTSQIEKDRRNILKQLNNYGRLLEQRAPAQALEFNATLRKVVERLAAWATQPVKNPGRAAKGTGR